MALSTINYTGTTGVLTSGTAVASTSGTSIDFTGIPSWVKRITVMLNGVSLSGTSNILIQVGTNTPTTTGYTSSCAYNAGAGGVGAITSTSGCILQLGVAAYAVYGALTIVNVTGTTWVLSGVYGNSASTPFSGTPAGNIALGSVLNMVRITTVNGTDTFDAGSINILYE